MPLNLTRLVNVISKAWGNQDGYAFFPYIDRKAQRESGLRHVGYHEGIAFHWPADVDKIKKHLQEHLAKEHDVYWCPSLFEYPTRRGDYAMDEHALWADLDEVDPREIRDYPPTIAWESSPNRFQALWLTEKGDFQGASWPGNENQKLTYMLGADPSGWDTTQLLRLPGWPNFKPERIEANGGKAPMGKLLWSAGQTYTLEEFKDLPEVQGASSYNSVMIEAFESEVEDVDRLKVLAKLKIKLNATARELLKAREVSGDRSSQMWYLMRCLADAGATSQEIVAIIRPLVWNKFDGRADEMKRLHTEASKAIASKSDGTLEELDEEERRKTPQRLGQLLRDIKRPVWLVENVVTEGACGFIAGEPKTWKSWVGYDLIQSVATGADFLGHFPVKNPGPVLYIQEEDPLPTLKSRGAKIWASKSIDKMELAHDGNIYWLPPAEERMFDPDINAYVQQGVTISDEAWQMWLDETLETGMVPLHKTEAEPYRLVVIDTLMMTAGDVDENRAQEMTTKIFRPLKVLSRKHNVALLVVHHMNKGENKRMGQRMLGSVANHAWGEDSVYLTHGTRRGEIKMEFESKVAPGQLYKISNLDNERWDPMISPWDSQESVNENRSPVKSVTRSSRNNGSASRNQGNTAKRSGNGQRVIDALEYLKGPRTVKEIADHLQLSNQQIYRALRLVQDQVQKTPEGWVVK